MIVLSVVGGASAAESPALGEWRVEDGAATIKIVDCGGRLWGVVASEKIPGGIDAKNPDKAKRNRPTLGIPVLINMKKSADERDKFEGNIYNAKDGKTYEASIQVKSANTLEVEGCVLSILCGGQTWTRVPDSAAAKPALPGAAKPATPVAGASPAGTKPPAPNGAPKPPGLKPGAAPVSEVCLLPEIAGAPH